MCLAIPGRVEEISIDNGIRVGRMNFGGVTKRVCLEYVPELVVGDYAIVHVGFAISRIDEETAEKTLADFRALGVLEEELANEDEAFARAAVSSAPDCPACEEGEGRVRAAETGEVARR